MGKGKALRQEKCFSYALSGNHGRFQLHGIKCLFDNLWPGSGLAGAIRQDLPETPGSRQSMKQADHVPGDMDQPATCCHVPLRMVHHRVTHAIPVHR